MNPKQQANGESTEERAGTGNYFPTQRPAESIQSTITDLDRSFGAPFGPVPASFRVLPEALQPCNAPATQSELALAAEARKPFEIPDYPPSYLHDIVRAFRLLKERRVFLEIGTFDRGNLAYVSRLLADDALLIGVDVQDEPARDALLRSVLKPRQTYISIVGDSRSPDTVAKAANHLTSFSGLDAVFIDGCHTAHGVMCDYANYGELVRPNGLIMTHDSLWEGSTEYKGSADALAEIDRLDPIYLVPGEGPAYRFMRSLWRDAMWGVVGIHVKSR